MSVDGSPGSSVDVMQQVAGAIPHRRGPGGYAPRSRMAMGAMVAPLMLCGLVHGAFATAAGSPTSSVSNRHRECLYAAASGSTGGGSSAVADDGEFLLIGLTSTSATGTGVVEDPRRLLSNRIGSSTSSTSAPLRIARVSALLAPEDKVAQLRLSSSGASSGANDRKARQSFRFLVSELQIQRGGASTPGGALGGAAAKVVAASTGRGSRSPLLEAFDPARAAAMLSPFGRGSGRSTSASNSPGGSGDASADSSTVVCTIGGMKPTEKLAPSATGGQSAAGRPASWPLSHVPVKEAAGDEEEELDGAWWRQV